MTYELNLNNAQMFFVFPTEIWQQISIISEEKNIRKVNIGTIKYYLNMVSTKIKKKNLHKKYLIK